MTGDNAVAPKANAVVKDVLNTEREARWKLNSSRS